MANKFLLLKTTTFLLGDGFTKRKRHSFIDEFSLKPTKKDCIPLPIKIKEDLILKISRKESF
jgi:hypothetical protein